jgi:hypothetical protein
MPPDGSGVILRWWTQEGLASGRVLRANATIRRRVDCNGGDRGGETQEVLEVSQATLEVVEWEMRAFQDQQVAMDS